MCHCHDNLACSRRVARLKTGFREIKKQVSLKRKKIEFRCSSLEKAIIEKKAEKTGLSVSEYCRNAALSRQLKNRLDNQELAVYKNLTTYAINFTRIGNLLKNKDSQFAKEISKTVKAIREHLKKLE